LLSLNCIAAFSYNSEASSYFDEDENKLDMNPPFKRFSACFSNECACSVEDIFLTTRVLLCV